MSQDKKLRTFDDLLRVVRALAYEFKTDTVFVVGSQAILASMPDAPQAARVARNRCFPPECADLGSRGSQAYSRRRASNRIGTHRRTIRVREPIPPHARFLHRRVDDTTAKLPKGWQGRAVRVRTEVEGRTVTGVAPSAVDLVVSKIARLDDRDKRFVEAIHAQQPLDLELVERKIGETDLGAAVAERATAYIRSLKREEKLPGPKPPWASSEENG